MNKTSMAFPLDSVPDSVPSATSLVTKELRRRIITGELRPAEKLQFEVLGEELGVDATPIREALSMLASDSLVERLDHRDFRVAPTSASHFKDVLQERCWLEDRALRESITQGDAAWEEVLVVAHHRMKRTDRSDSADPEADDSWEALHKQFHMVLISACGSEVLTRFCSHLYDQNTRYRFLITAARGYSARDVTHGHEGILEAALERNAEGAVQRLLEHYRRTGEFLEDALR